MTLPRAEQLRRRIEQLEGEAQRVTGPVHREPPELRLFLDKLLADDDELIASIREQRQRGEWGSHYDGPLPKPGEALAAFKGWLSVDN